MKRDHTQHAGTSKANAHQIHTIYFTTKCHVNEFTYKQTFKKIFLEYMAII